MRERKMKNTDSIFKQKKWLLAIAIPVATLVILYLIMTFYFKDHFFFGSVINGVNYGGKTVSQVEDLISSESSNYSIELIGRNDLKDVITASDINYQYLSDGSVKSLKNKQNPFFWIGALFQKKNSNEMTINTSFDEKALKDCLSKTVFFDKRNIEKPKSAYIKYDKSQKEYVLVPEKKGSKLLKNKTLEAIKTAISTGETTINLDESGCYKQPKYTTETPKMAAFFKKVQLYSNACITYDFSDRQEVVDTSTIRKWLKVNNKKLKVTLDENAIKEYVDYLGRNYSTFGSSREFKTSSGKTITVSGGDYGWLINRPAEVKALTKNIKKGKTITKEPVYTQKAVSRNKNDIGDTYVEIDLTKQHLWFYKEGKQIVESDFVSGNASRGWATPAGIYQITYKERNALLGANSGADYRSPVSYWMPFNGNIGMHDAPWRRSFGGNIYKTNGSHGCINMPINNAKTVFENISAGVPVVLYH